MKKITKSKTKLFLLAILGLCMAGNTWALDQDASNVYQIRTAQDWIEFCNIHNNGDNQNLNAELKADITVEGNYMVGINGNGKPYSGTFNGQGHTITINYDLNEQRVAPFRRVNGGAVKNLIVMGTITTTSKLASGIVGGIWQSGNIENCVSYVTINDNSGLDNGNPTDATHGGICGSFEDTNTSLGITITNCAFLGTINAPYRKGCGGIVGWTNNGTISNCYVGGVLNLATGQDNNIICRDNNSPTVSNCYYTDLQSMNGHSGASQKNLNELQSALGGGWSEIYSGAAPLPSVFVPTKNSDNYYELSTASHLRQFAELVNNSDNSANAKMMNDINLSNIWTPIGNDGHRYIGTFDGGTFDGQCHVIDNLKIENGGEKIGIFGVVNGGCVIKNLIAGPGNSIKGTSKVGGIIGCSDGSGWVTLENVGHEGYVEGSGSNCCAIIGVVMNGGPATRITNCYNTGDIKGNNESAIITGWFGGHGSVEVKGFYNTGNIQYGQDGDNFLWRNGNTAITTERIYNINTNQGATPFSDGDLTSGKLAYLLNGSSSENPVWHQTIGSDTHPVPFAQGHKAVYKFSDVYTNFQSIDGDGYFHINDAEDLLMFANTVNQGNTNIKGKLTENINMEGHSDFYGIGTETYPFKGEIDGAKKIISNWNVSDTSSKVGLVRYANGGLTLKNITIASSCSFTGDGSTAAFVADLDGAGNVNLLNLGNEANVTGGKNASGILGCNFSGSVFVTMKNCYNSGNITATEEGGALSGWLGSAAKVYNCYNTGEITNGAKLCRGNDSYTNENTFTTSTSTSGDNCWNATNETTQSEDFANGKVFAKLYAYNSNSVDGSVWRWETSGTPHPVLYGNKIAMNEDCTNRRKSGSEYDVTMFRTIKTGGWNTVCLPFYLAPTQVSSYFGSEAKVAMLDNSKSGSGDVLYFKSVNDGITAGQAYLVYPSVGFTSKEITGVTIYAADPQNVCITQAGFTFLGVYDPTELTANTDRIVAGGNTIVKTSGGTLKGFRAYFKPVNANARATRFVIDDDVTGIITPEGEFIEDGPVYNLGGQRVNKPQRGLYIQNGKKVVIK